MDCRWGEGGEEVIKYGKQGQVVRASKRSPYSSRVGLKCGVAMRRTMHFSLSGLVSGSDNAGNIPPAPFLFSFSSLCPSFSFPLDTCHTRQRQAFQPFDNMSSSIEASAKTDNLYSMHTSEQPKMNIMDDYCRLDDMTIPDPPNHTIIWDHSMVWLDNWNAYSIGFLRFKLMYPAMIIPSIYGSWDLSCRIKTLWAIACW